MNEWKRLFSFVREQVECVLSKSFCYVDRGVTMGGMEAQFPGRRITIWGSKNCESAEKSQQYYK